MVHRSPDLLGTHSPRDVMFFQCSIHFELKFAVQLNVNVLNNVTINVYITYMILRTPHNTNTSLYKLHIKLKCDIRGLSSE